MGAAALWPPCGLTALATGSWTREGGGGFGILDRVWACRIWHRVEISTRDTRRDPLHQPPQRRVPNRKFLLTCVRKAKEKKRPSARKPPPLTLQPTPLAWKEEAPVEMFQGDPSRRAAGRPFLPSRNWGPGRARTRDTNTGPSFAPAGRGSLSLPSLCVRIFFYRVMYKLAYIAGPGARADSPFWTGPGDAGLMMWQATPGSLDIWGKGWCVCDFFSFIFRLYNFSFSFFQFRNIIHAQYHGLARKVYVY